MLDTSENIMSPEAVDNATYDLKFDQIEVDYQFPVTAEEQRAIDRVSCALADEIDKEVINLIITEYKKVQADKFDEAMGVIEPSKGQK